MAEPALKKTLKAQAFNLLGKDYLTEDEAAHYMGVSLSQFRKEKKKYGIMPGRVMGKKQYRRVDLQRAMESGFMGIGV